jgi:hypothetical protein
MNNRLLSWFAVVILTVCSAEIVQARMVGKPQVQAAYLKCIDVKTPSGCEICCGEGDFNECQAVPCNWLDKVNRSSSNRGVPSRIDPRRMQQ